MRTQRKQPGKKSGARIKNCVAVIPLGIKRNRYELDARAALLAMKHNVHNEQHLVDLFVLAEICERLSDERYIRVHSASVKRLIDQAHNSEEVKRLDYLAMEPSADVLLGFFAQQKNADIVRVCLEGIK